MTKKLFNILVLSIVCGFLYSQNHYSAFILGNSQVINSETDLISIADLTIQDGKYYLTVSNGYQVKKIPVKLESEIKNGFVKIDYKLSKNESIVKK